MPSQSSHFGIVGGGILGLTLALRLAQRHQRVTLLEAADHVGGLADAWTLGDVTWPIFGALGALAALGHLLAASSRQRRVADLRAAAQRSLSPCA